MSDMHSLYEKQVDLLNLDGEWWNEEYERCFGEPPPIRVEYGTDMLAVCLIQSRIMRWHIERMKDGKASQGDQ
jgi:hypothetical protein